MYLHNCTELPNAFWDFEIKVNFVIDETDCLEHQAELVSIDRYLSVLVDIGLQ